ncbi:peptidoglycan-binding protein LysM [Tamilnaduibacter salinus]|uniref:Peptidoglycan-binding protein LysM n=2 Tax=Tamilnaduibacter salinus TaxID=1484056 RepID=A0A2A2I296_9GAMM|nr:peptidoglycan-binding protein LysM [Tamilnaduibacter salinus]
MNAQRRTVRLTSQRPRWSAIQPALAVMALLISLTAMAELSVTQGSAVAAESGSQTSSPQPEWTYTLRPDDTVQAVARRVLSSQHSVRDLMRVNGLTKANKLQAGDTLNIPLSWLEERPEPAVAVAVNGTAHHVSPRHDRQRPLKPQQQLYSGDEIRTLTGFVVIQLADGSVVRLGPHSQMTFNRLTRYRKTAMVDTRLRLRQGSLETEVQPMETEGSRFEVHTPSAVAAVRGTDFRLQALNGHTRLQVTAGSVAFGPPGEAEMVPAGYGAISGGQTRDPVDIRPLPPQPEGSPIPNVIESLPATVKWQGSAPDDRFQVDIFNEQSQAWIDRRTVEEPQTALQNLDNGRYRIRVAALTDNGIAGEPWQETVTVEQKALSARLSSPADGASLKDDMPSFQWAYQGTNEIGRIEIARNSDFTGSIATSEWAPDARAIPSKPLAPDQYYWRVVTRAGGDSEATSESRTFTIEGTLPPTAIINVNYIDSQVRIFWEAIDGADGYRMQLAEDPGFDNIVREAEIDNTTAALRLIPGRRYFVRLQALSDTADKNGRWGSPRELFVN